MLPTSNAIHHRNQNHERYITQNDERSFHIERETFYQNNFKKIKPNQIKFRQNKNRPNVTMSKAFLNAKSGEKLKNISNIGKFIQASMRNKKQNYQDQINHNLLQINKSFNRYFQGKTHQQQSLNQQRKKKLSCKNILKELKKMQSEKSFNLPLVNLNQKSILEKSAQINYEILNLQNNCLDTLFPFQRHGPAINFYQNQLILHGGFTAGKKPSVSCFHKYSFQKRLWLKVEQLAGTLSMIPCFHTIDIYKNYMVLVGGVSLFPQSGRRKFNSDICIFNFERKQWFKLRSAITTRSHASTIFGNTLMIHGGIDDKEFNSNQMHFINFNAASIQGSIIHSIQNKKTQAGFKHNLSNHKLTNVKMLLKYDGVFCFGGADDQGQMHNQITFLNCIGKDNALDVRFQSWNVIELIGNGPRPEARKNHTFNIINKRALVVLMGGQNMQGKNLKDIWLFDLVKLQWKQINPFSRPSPQLITKSSYIRTLRLQQTISGHCATFMGTRLYVFGGKKAVYNKKQNSLWCIQTDLLNNLSKKLKIQKYTNTQINTIKDTAKSESMWNIQF